MSEFTTSSDSDLTGFATGLVSVSARLAKEVFILGLTAVWTVVWIALTFETVQNEGLADGVIIGVYSLAPAVFILGWRLQANTGVQLPTFEDLVGETESGNGDASDAGSVADRYTVGRR